MNKNNTWIGIAAVCFVLAGCIQSASDKKEEADTGENTEKSAGAEDATAIAKKVDPNAVNLSTGVDGLNPPHGQPGHVCGIPVGAPLNNASNQNQGGAPLPASAQPAPAGQPAGGNSPGNTQPLTLGNGMVATPMEGPPPGYGGQPGQTQPQAQQAPSGLPPGAKPYRPADGINPPHGEPGHDCGVEVGAPLPPAK